MYRTHGDSRNQSQLDTADSDSKDLTPPDTDIANTSKTSPHPDTLILNNPASNSLIKEPLSGLPLQDSNQAKTDLDPLTGDFITEPSAIADIEPQSSQKTDALLNPSNTAPDNSTRIETKATPLQSVAEAEDFKVDNTAQKSDNNPQIPADLRELVNEESSSLTTAYSFTYSDTDTKENTTDKSTLEQVEISANITEQQPVGKNNNSETLTSNLNTEPVDSVKTGADNDTAAIRAENAALVDTTSPIESEIEPTVITDSSETEAVKPTVVTHSNTITAIQETIATDSKPTIVTDSNTIIGIQKTTVTDSNITEADKPTVVTDANTIATIHETIASDSKTTEEVKETVETTISTSEKVETTFETALLTSEKVETTVETAIPTSDKVEITIETALPISEQLGTTFKTILPASDKVKPTIETASIAEEIAPNTPKEEPNSSQQNSNSNNSLIEKNVKVQQPDNAIATSPNPTLPQTPTPTEPQTQIAVNNTTNIPTTLADNNNTSTNPSPTIAPQTNTNHTFTSGVFTVGTTGKVSIDYLFDGGLYQGELAVFSLSNMEDFTPGTPEFIAEAARRALTNSELGNIAIKDSTEGARFSGAMPGEKSWNLGQYQDPTTFNMAPGDTFGIMLIPNGTVQQVFKNPSVGGNLRPLFSLSTANPAEGLQLGQIADVTGNGNTFAYEDLRADGWTDKDYNDIIFSVTGATGIAPPLSSVINPSKEWRNSTLGKELIDYVLTLKSDHTPPAIAASLIQDTGSSNSDRLTNNPTISGTVTDSSSISSFSADFNNNSSKIELKNLLTSDGKFTLTRDILTTINNGSELPDGAHTLSLQAVDIHGNTSSFELDFTLDTTASITLSLDPAFDSAPIGDSDTENQTVTLKGQTEASSAIALLETGEVATANATGEFQFPGVILTPGSNSFTATTTDKAGNASTTTLTVKYNPPVPNNKVPTDLGGAYTFTGRTASGNNDGGSANQYTFGIANSELNSTDSDTVLVGVSVASKGNQGLPELPEVGGLTPILKSTDTNSTYSLFSINRSGLNLLNLNSASSSAYTLKLNVAGDINSDGRVDTTDRQLLENALGRTATDPDYTIDSDINRDGIINSADQTLFNSNFGFIANKPPVASPFSTSTHTELETVIPLIGKATDPEGDSIFYNALNPVNGTVQLDPITKTATFKPTPGFSGIASFELAASDGYNWGVSATVTVNVSGAPLISLDFANRNPQLYAGDSTELTVLGDFADQKGVVLPDSYLTYTSFNPGVAPIDTFGKVTGLADGTSIFSASHNNLQAVIPLRIGALPQPTTDTELNQVLAQMYGLDPYPHAVSLVPGATRKLSIGLNSSFSQPNLTADTGTHYFASNSNVLNVSPDGVITAVGTGDATVTAIYGAGSVTIPVRVAAPQFGPAPVGIEGGVISSSDLSSTVMIPPGALKEDSKISITPLNRENLSLPIPAGFEFAGAFNLDFNGGPLNLPAQLAIPAPSGLAPGTQVYFMRKGAIPDQTGTWNPMWLQEESGIVGEDGTIRTSSPPYPGVVRPGEYTVLYSSPTGDATLVKGQLTLNYNVPLAFFGIIDPFGGIGQLLSPNNFVTGFTVTHDISSVKVVAIPTVGLPVVTEVGVQRNNDGIATFKAALNMPAPTSSDPTTPPVLQKAELKFKDEFGQDFENKEPLLFLSGGNILVNNASDSKGSQFEDLTVKFHVGNQVFEGQVVPTHSRSGGGNQYEIAVKVPNTVPLGASRIVVTRKQNQIVDQSGTAPAKKEVKYDSNPIQLPQGAEYVFAALGNADRVAVLNAKNPELVVENSDSFDLLSAQIPVGTSGVTDWAEASAATSDGTRVYVVLRESGQVALVDPIVLKQVDTQPHTAGVNPIVLPTGAKPKSIVIDSRSEYAYIADRDRGSIYVLDIDPFSVNYHKIIATISIGSNTTLLRNLAISSDGRKFFATASDNYIYAVNIDPASRPNDPNSNQSKWHQQIGKVLTPNGASGLTATPDPLKMVFTSGNTGTDGKGYGVLEITNDDPLNFTATNRYIDLSLGSANDYFDVNEGVSITVMRDGRYGFVAGRNNRDNIALSPDPRSGSNIGIIKDPLGSNPTLVAATRPIPGGLTNDLVLSADNKSLFSSYPAPGSAGGIYVFNVEEMIKTLSHPEDYKIDSLDRGMGSTFFNQNTQRVVTANDFAKVPIDDINPAISIAADYEITKENRPANQFTYGVPSGTTRAPVGTGGNLRDLSIAPTDWLDLLGPGATTNDLTPTLNWKFDPGWEDVKEVNLFVSTFDKGQGLLAWDKVVDLSDSTLLPGLSETQKRQLLSKPWNGYDDFNPNRILTATWKQDTGKWYWHDGVTPIDQPLNDPANTSTSFTLPKSLTAGQNYNFAVEAISNSGAVMEDEGQFKTTSSVSNSPFSSVSVLTPGFTLLPGNAGIDKSFYQMANKIADVSGNTPESSGLIMRYDKPTGNWVPIDGDGGVITDLMGGLETSDANYLSTLANNLKNGILKDGKKIEYLNQNKPLVLLPEWSLDRESVIPDVGFSEGAADALFASMVQLDQALGGGVGQRDNLGNLESLYDSKGDLIRTQGAVFNSPLHFVGFSRGTVVNSEIIQRFGTYFPEAGGVQGSGIKDLQMTTVDPHDFYQPSLNLTLPGFISTNFSDFYEPKVQVWNNVTFADNYYQTVADPNGFTATPNGRNIPYLPIEELNKNPRPVGLNFPLEDGITLGHPDLEVLLGTREGQPGRENSRLGFTKDDGLGSPHIRTWSWYAGTVDLDISEVRPEYPHASNPNLPEGINDQLGDKDTTKLFDPNFPNAKPWYSNSSGEGVGEGWFYSVLGGGKDKRPDSPFGRVPVSFDNTLSGSMRGDFAVPTLFNGNFDQFIPNKSNAEDFGRNLISKEIPGWSFHNGATSTLVAPTNNLVDWREIDGLMRRWEGNNQPNYLEKLGINPFASGYQPNYALRLQSGESMEHNRFVVPDWGTLRFNLHVPELNGGQLKVSIQGDAPGYENYQPIGNIDLRVADGRVNPGAIPEIAYPTGYADTDTNRIGYGNVGFETFHVDVPEILRGKSAKLKFELEENDTVYLDDVFFKSTHLMFGNPTLNGQEARPDAANNPNNYLIEKPQYSLSYNESNKGSNWVSWQLNKTWLGNLRTPEGGSAEPYDPFPWKSDSALPSELDTTEGWEYGLSGFDRGHLTAREHRNRTQKDQFATFLTTNLLPQESDSNRLGAWRGLEVFSKGIVEDRGWELYNIAGGYESYNDELPPDNPLNIENINVPELMWKVIVPLRPGQGIADVTANTPVIAVMLPNFATNPPGTMRTPWFDPTNITTVNRIEELTGLDLLSNLPDEIENILESRFYDGSVTVDGFPNLVT